MDENRRIRFLIPPALFMASLLLGAYCDQQTFQKLKSIVSSHDGWTELLKLIAAGSFVVFVAGYIIGTISYFFLRILFLPLQRHHEAILPWPAFRRVLEKLGAPEGSYRSREFFAAIAFDFYILRSNYEGVHAWLFRRWNGFNTAANSIWALGLSFAVGHFWLDIPSTRTWCFSVFGFAFMLLLIAVWAWRDTMRMLNFMAHLSPRNDSGTCLKG